MTVLGIEAVRARDALVHCNSEGAVGPIPNLNYEWSISKTPLFFKSSIADRLVISASGSLLIHKFTERDHGRYTCEIKQGDVTMQEIHVDVDERSSFSSQI